MRDKHFDVMSGYIMSIKVLLIKAGLIVVPKDAQQRKHASKNVNVVAALVIN